MASAAISVPSNVRGVLARLRWQVRAYVLLEGLSLATSWLAAMFWAALAFDYLPILVGATELPMPARALILAGVLLVFAVIIQRMVIRRLAVRLSDRSLAILLERRFGQFRDGLVTTVELAGRKLNVPMNSSLLSATARDAGDQLGQIRLMQVFQFRPLISKIATAAALIVSLIAFYLINQPTFLLAANRLVLLDGSAWPRSARIEVAGVEVIPSANAGNTAPVSQWIHFTNRELKVAKGANINLRVRADGAARVVPDYCTIQYQTSQGDRGRVQMKRLGQIHSELLENEKRSVQNYSYDGKPFKSILADIRFDVIGYDHRLSDYHIRVVESPTLSNIVLDCQLPTYIVNDDAVAAGRQIEYLPSGTQVPMGTIVVVRARSNKPLQQVFCTRVDSGSTFEVTGPFANDGFDLEFPIGALNANQTLEISLVDVDHVTTERPIRIAIAVIPDEAPRVDIRLRGISNAVTPDVSIPVVGKITDDYQVVHTWLDLQMTDRDAAKSDLELGPAGTLDTLIDFRKLRQSNASMELKPKDSLTLRIFAEDGCALENGANQGISDSFQLNVVTAAELLAMLESRELALRRRFEQIIEELTETRDSLLRVKLEGLGADSSGRDPADNRPSATEPDDQRSDAERLVSLRLLRVQKASQQTQKSSQEVLGVAVSFDDIRDEMLNNRLEVADRVEQLRDKIIEPLKQTIKVDFVELSRLLTELESVAIQLHASDQVDPSIQATDALISKLNDILQNMLDIETYNELLDIVRSLIKDQDELMKKTKDQKMKQLLDLSQ